MSKATSYLDNPLSDSVNATSEDAEPALTLEPVEEKKPPPLSIPSDSLHPINRVDIRADQSHHLQPLTLAKVICCYEADNSSIDITINMGDILVITAKSETGWWTGKVVGKSEETGYFPAYCVEEIDHESSFNIYDPEFVPEGFHENCRDENGAVKITEQNKHLYQDVEHLARIYKEDGWAQTPGVLYTGEMSGCPNGRLPTIESLISLQLSGYKLNGRIMMTDNAIMDADTHNSIENLTLTDYQNIMNRFSVREEWERRSGLASVMDRFLLDSDFDKYVDGERFRIPKGEYKLKEITHKKSEEGLACFSCCDEPNCCIMTQTLLSACASGVCPCDEKQIMMDFFKNRKMYKKYDEVNGNVDMCLYCLDKSITE